MNDKPERNPNFLEYIVVIIMVFFVTLGKLIIGAKPKKDIEEN